MIVLGDLNVKFLAPGDNKDLKSVSELFGFKQIIEKPTRITETTRTLIDVVLTNTTEQVCKMIFMRAQTSMETETIVKFESLQTLHVSAGRVTTPKTFTATTMSRGKGLMYINQMELYRTNQNEDNTASLGPS